MATAGNIAATLAPSFLRFAGSIAVEDGDQRITYRDLDDLSDRIAASLLAAGVTHGARVCLLMSKSVRAVASILAVVKLGAAYVPLDPSSPVARLSPMVAACSPCWLLFETDLNGMAGQLARTLPPAEQPELVDLDQAVVGGRADPARLLVKTEQATADDLAYILFTSGSTGVPKGVPIAHRSVTDYVDWTNRHFGIVAEDRIACQAPLHFDMSVWDIFGTLLAGATLVLVPREAGLIPESIAVFMREATVNQWYSVPSLLVGMAMRDVVRPGDFPALKRIIWGGEAFPVPELRYWIERVPHARFTNVYGPTEATVNCTYYPVDVPPPADAKSVPIGYAIPGRTLRVVDEEGRELPRGTVGELHIGGIGLSPGYWRDPAKTAAAFIVGKDGRWYRTGDLAIEDEAGAFHFRGRADRQIKSRGYRIELDDVAFALRGLDGIADCAVVATSVGGFEGMRICAAYVAMPGTALSPATVKAALGQVLPHYMLPRRWRALAALPINANGKVDMPAIKAMFTDE